MLMTYINPFLSYLEVNYKDAIDDLILDWLHTDFNEYGGLRVANKAKTKLIHSSFKHVKIKDRGEMKVRFYLTVEIDVMGAFLRDDGHIIAVHLPTFWITITFDADLSNYLDNISAKGVELYCKKNKLPHQVSGDLTPYFTSIKDYEKEAEHYIRTHVDPNYDGSKVIPIMQIINKSGLEAYDFKFAGKIKPFGRIFFEDGTCRVFDREEQKEITSHISKNTICVDLQKNSSHSEHSKNITLAHEMSHYILHRKAFYFQKLVNTDLVEFSCNYSGLTVKGFSSDLLRKMEIQASIMGPILLMPRKALTAYVKKEIALYDLFETNDPLMYISQIIDDVSKEFHVTKYAARRRLFDIGFFQHSDACIWINGHYIKPFSYKKGTLADDETYVISYEQLKNLELNKSFREMFNLGYFVFVEDHVCLNDSRFITKDSKGDLCLTSEARHRVDTCCLKFKLKDVSKSDPTAMLNSLYRDLNKELCYNVSLALTNSSLEKRMNAAKRIRYKNNVLEAKKNIMSMDFKDALRYLYKFQGMSQQELADAAGLSRKTIERYLRRDEQGTLPDKPCAVRLCIGLKLNRDLSIMLCTKAHHSFDEADDLDSAYIQVFDTMTEHRLEYIEKYFIASDLPNALKPTNSSDR